LDYEVQIDPTTGKNKYIEMVDTNKDGAIERDEYMAFKYSTKDDFMKDKECVGGSKNSLGQCDCPAGNKFVPQWSKCVPADMTVPPTHPTGPPPMPTDLSQE